MDQVSCVSSIRPLGALEECMDFGRTLSPCVFRRKMAATRSGNSHEMRIIVHEMRQACRPNGSGVTPREAKPGLDLGDLGAAHRHPMRRRTVEFHDRAVAFLA